MIIIAWQKNCSPFSSILLLERKKLYFSATNQMQIFYRNPIGVHRRKHSNRDDREEIEDFVRKEVRRWFPGKTLTRISCRNDTSSRVLIEFEPSSPLLQLPSNVIVRLPFRLCFRVYRRYSSIDGKQSIEESKHRIDRGNKPGTFASIVRWSNLSSVPKAKFRDSGRGDSSQLDVANYAVVTSATITPLR